MATPKALVHRRVEVGFPVTDREPLSAEPRERLEQLLRHLRGFEVTDREQCIMRIVQGRPIPEGWEMVKWLGTETDILYGPTFKADVVLVERIRQEAGRSD